MKTKRRIGRILSVEREPSKRIPERMNIKTPFENRNGEKVWLWTSEFYPWSLLYLCKRAGLHKRNGAYNPQRLIGRDIWLILRDDISRGRPFTRVALWI